jgi:protein-tyrosine phosphatase
MVGQNDEINLPDVDPTYVPVEVADDFRNPFVRRMRGIAHQGHTPFDVPYISLILPGFYQGGCEHGLVLPREIEHVISLYRWEKYDLHDGVQTFHEVTMYDSNDGPDHDNIVELATLVNECRKQGNTLVHCQAGLNRSGLVAGAALVMSGMTGQEAIDTLRASRSPAVLCNQTFAEWLLDFKP